MKNIRSIIPIILVISFIANLVTMTLLLNEKEARCHDLEVLDAKIKEVYALNPRVLPKPISAPLVHPAKAVEVLAANSPTVPEAR